MGSKKYTSSGASSQVIQLKRSIVQCEPRFSLPAKLLLGPVYTYLKKIESAAQKSDDFNGTCEQGFALFLIFVTEVCYYT